MFDSLHNVTLSRPRIVIESLLEHFIFLNVLGGTPNPPQGEVATHKYLHHNISNPPFTNPVYTHVMTLCNYNSISIWVWQSYAHVHYYNNKSS